DRQKVGTRVGLFPRFGLSPANGVVRTEILIRVLDHRQQFAVRDALGIEDKITGRAIAVVGVRHGLPPCWSDRFQSCRESADWNSPPAPAGSRRFHALLNIWYAIARTSAGDSVSRTHSPSQSFPPWRGIQRARNGRAAVPVAPARV